MAKCKICGKHGLFFKVNSDGVCPDCIRLADIQERERIADIRLSDKEKLIKTTQDTALRAIQNKIDKANADLAEVLKTYADESEKLSEAKITLDKSTKQWESQTRKVSKLKEIYKSMEYSVDTWYATGEFKRLQGLDNALAENLSPTAQIPLNCLNYKDLRKRFNENDKAITDVMEKYKARYTTKTIAAIYKLMVIALRAELQNILTGLKFGKVDNAIEQIKATTTKYLAIATEGNQTIANTLVKFIGQIEYLFIEAAKIEYEYYIQREQIKEEQRALREQLRQEAAERKLLEEQQKKVEEEESKYKAEIESLTAALGEATGEKADNISARISELNEQLLEVDKKKEEIASLQHGKAGYVYVISNLGSFGDNVFKIGMTRRLVPEERIDELGSASVPFPFDIHSMIFSDNAPELETAIHKMLNDKRVNKVNLRKEFFRVSLDDLEKLVFELQPTAEFNRTMLAEQYNQTLSIEAGIAQAFDGVLNELDGLDDEELNA